MITPAQLPDSPGDLTLYCRSCTARYSATRGDYSLRSPHRVMRCECGHSLTLGFFLTRFVECLNPMRREKKKKKRKPLTDTQIRALIDAADDRGDVPTMAVCLVALGLGDLWRDDGDARGWEHECLQEASSFLEAKGMHPIVVGSMRKARIECIKLLGRRAYRHIRLEAMRPKSKKPKKEE
jgi:integrase